MLAAPHWTYSSFRATWLVVKKVTAEIKAFKPAQHITLAPCHGAEPWGTGTLHHVGSAAGLARELRYHLDHVAFSTREGNSFL